MCKYADFFTRKQPEINHDYSHSLASNSGTSPSLKTSTTHCPSDTHSLADAVTDKSLLTGADSDSVCTGLARCGDAAAGKEDTTGEVARFSPIGKLENEFSTLVKQMPSSTMQPHARACTRFMWVLQHVATYSNSRQFTPVV